MKDSENNDFLLLSRFNDRDKSAFADVYVKIFDELHHYASKLFYSTTIDPGDLLQDLFVNLWLSESVKFISMDHVKNYLYLSVRNKCRDFINHKKYVSDYELQIKNDEDFHMTMMIESEVISALNEALTVLPEECAKVFKLYVEGWDIKDIADQLDKAQSTVYNQKNLAISILKKKLSNNSFLAIMNFF